MVSYFSTFCKQFFYKFREPPDMVTPYVFPGFYVLPKRRLFFRGNKHTAAFSVMKCKIRALRLTRVQPQAFRTASASGTQLFSPKADRI